MQKISRLARRSPVSSLFPNQGGKPDWRARWAACRRGAPFQLGLLVGSWYLLLLLARWLGVAQLTGVIGMLALWLALVHGWVRLEYVRAGANWLIAHMLLFFIPAVLVILDHRELLGWTGLKLFLIIVLGTLAVMLSTALSIEWCLRLARRRQAARRWRHIRQQHGGGAAQGNPPHEGGWQ